MTTIKTINTSISSNSNSNNNINNMYADARFSCNICLDAVMEPVVTQCGHLYCWPCLYRWLEPGMSHIDRLRLNLSTTTSNTTTNTTTSLFQQQLLSNRANVNSSNGDPSRQVCPVCKAGCTIATIVPIYVRADSTAVVTPPTAPDTDQATASDPVIENSIQQSTTTTTTRIVVPSETTTTTSTATTPLRSNNNSSNINRPNSDDVDIQSVDEDNNDNNNDNNNNIIDLDDILSLEDEEDDDNDNNDHLMELTNDTTGIRQRRGKSNSHGNSVPRRPTATTPLSSQSSESTTLFTISSARNRSNSVPFIHRFDTAADTTSTDNYNNSNTSNTSMIIRGRGLSSFFNSTSTNPVLDESNNGTNSNSIDDPAATEYLSRILLLLGSFVILCLLLF